RGSAARPRLSAVRQLAGRDARRGRPREEEAEGDVTAPVAACEPLFSLAEDAYVVCAWWLHGREQDFMAVLQRPTDAADLRIDYRFRYYVDDKVFDSDDIKSAYSCDLTGRTEVESLAIVDEM